MTGGITPATRRVVNARADGRCEWCGRASQALQLHHRLFRGRALGRADRDLPDNLVALCGSGNHTGCHGRAHGAAPGDLDAAHAAGMTIPTGGEPLAVPIRSNLFGVHVWLREDGDLYFVPPAADPAAVPMMTPAP